MSKPLFDTEELYAEMSAPYETTEAGEAAIRAFVEDVEKLRRKHRIADAVVAVQVMTKDPRLSPARALFMGEQEAVAFIAAFAYGQASKPYLELARTLERVASGAVAVKGDE